MMRKHQNVDADGRQTLIDGVDIYLLTNIDRKDIPQLVDKSCQELLRQESRELLVRHLCRMNRYFLMSHQICHRKLNPKILC